MRQKERILLDASLCILVIMACTSCAPQSQRSSDAFTSRWRETERLFSDGRIDEALQQVEVLLNAPEPHQTKAAAWKMLVLGGKARGYLQLAEAYLAGSEQNPAQFSEFRRAVSKYRSHSRAASLALAQMAADSSKYFGNAETIPLEFPLPPGSTSLSPIVASIELGRFAPEAQLQAAEQYTLRRAIVLTVCEASRSTSDNKQRQEEPETPPMAIPKPRLLALMGKVLYEQTDLFTADHLDDPERHALLLDLSEQLLEASLLYQQQQKAGLELWRTELESRRSLP